jgi:hypothetical protein
MGYYGGKGMMRGRWCVPIRNAEGEVVGYIGRWATHPVPDGTAKYLLPPRFNKNGVLFNLDRIPLEVEHVVVVEGVFDAIRLDTLCVPTVAVLGTSVSDWHQHELATRFKTATVLWDGNPDGMPDADSLVAQDRAIAKLAEAMLTRSHRLSPGVDPASASRQVLLELVGSLRWRP